MNILFSEISCMVGDLMHMRFDAQVMYLQRNFFFILIVDNDMAVSTF